MFDLVREAINPKAVSEGRAVTNTIRTYPLSGIPDKTTFYEDFV
jgi:hypothetical protein